MRRAGLPALPLLGLVLAASACQSTQDKSAEIAASLGPVRQEKGLKITEESEDVEVTATELLVGESSSAVVVDLHNNSDRTLVDVPIAIDVLDAQGKSVYRNDIPGIEPALAGMPYIAAGADAQWVQNQVLPTGEPAQVEVEVGASKATFDGELPDIDVSEPTLEKDPISGLEATGSVTNNTDERQDRLLLYGVATKGAEIVAAGRGAIDHINAGRRLHYDIFFVGDPEGAEIAVTSFPTLEPQ